MDHQQKDETAVAYLATAMNTKLARARAKGRSGWDSPECTQHHLSNQLREHVEKGDPVDVANFCAFLAARGEGIAPRQCLAQIEEPAQGAKFFSASNEGLDEHDTAEAAQTEAQSIIDLYREEAADGWPEEVDSVCWGVILGKAVERPVQNAPHMAGILGSDMEPVDYVLEPVAAPALEAPAAPGTPEYIEGGRESVEDALAIVESFGTGIEGLNDEFARQIILAAEVRRLRGLYEQAVNGRSAFRDAYRKVRGAILPPLGCPACDITHAAKDCPQESALAAAPQAPAAPVAHLDLGAGGYMDLGTDLSEQQLGALPKGRHMLAIIGTYGIDGYAAAPAAPAEAQRLAQFLQDRQTCLGSSRASAGKYNQQSWDDYERAWTMLLGMAVPAAPAVDAWLQPDDMAALQRFHETAEDDESYDIGKEAVARLCAFGCLQSHSFGRYSTTDFGDYLLDTWAGARTLPFTTAAEREARAAQAKEGGAAC